MGNSKQLSLFILPQSQRHFHLSIKSQKENSRSNKYENQSKLLACVFRNRTTKEQSYHFPRFQNTSSQQNPD